MKNINVSAIMSRAWAIRKAAAREMACRPSEVLMSECLRMAWAESTPARAAAHVVRDWAGRTSADQTAFIRRVLFKALQGNPRAGLAGYGSDPDTVDALVSETFVTFAPTLDVDRLTALNTKRAARDLKPITLAALIYRAANAAIERAAYANKRKADFEVSATVQTSDDEEADLFDLHRADKMQKDNCGITRETENIVVARYSLDAIRATLEGRDEIDRTIAAMAIGEHTERQIAEAVGISHQAVHKRLAKLRAALEIAGIA